MVELAIVIVLVGIIAMTASLLIGQSAQTYQKEDNYSAALNQGRLALEKMAREIRMVRSASDIILCATVPTPAFLTFTDVTGNSYAYTYSGTMLTENGNTLADNLTVFTIAYFDKTGAAPATCSAIWTVTIHLTASQGGESLPLEITLHPRGF